MSEATNIDYTPLVRDAVYNLISQPEYGASFLKEVIKAFHPELADNEAAVEKLDEALTEELQRIAEEYVS